VTALLDAAFAGTDVSYEIDNKYILLGKRYNITSVMTVGQTEKRISGKVIDTTGESVIGANIMEKGTQNGVITDVDGNFILTVRQGAVLVVSYIGYITQEIPVGAQTDISVTLKEDNFALEEVVVVGYGTQKKINVTGAVASASGDILTKRPVSNSSAMLEGMLPGVEVVSATGEPGNEGTSIKIRGTGTFSSAGSAPLVLIDGVIGSLSNLNPRDIENVSVLKDAASASIYGARAANGVILVTTKSGTEDGLNIDYSGNFAIHTYTKMLDVISNSAEYMELWNEAKLNSGYDVGLYTQEMIDAYRYATDKVQYPNTNWLELMFGPAPTHTHNLSFRGGNRATKYNVSLGYVDQKGVMKGFDYKRYNVRLNLTSQVNKVVKFGTIIGFSHGDRVGARQGSQDQFIATMAQAPTYGPYLPDGSGRYTFKAYDFEYNNKNPMVIYKEGVSAKVKNYSFAPQGWVEITPFRNFTWYTKAAVNIDFENNRNFRPQVPLYNYHTGQYMTLCDVGGAGLTETESRNIYLNLFSHVSYEHLFNDAHQMRLQIGYNVEKNSYHTLSGSRRNYANDDLREMDAGSQDVMTAGGTTTEWALLSYFGRLNYSYKDRYLLETNLRYDGTSRLPRDGRWGLFPSASAAWRISEEQFVKSLDLPWLNNVKIRGSYGILGNQNIGDYPYQAILSYHSSSNVANYSFDNSSLSTGINQAALNNLNITWESTAITDIGLDVTAFDGFSLSFDWYNKRTSDILTSIQVTALVGLTAPTVNKGILENKGFETSLSYNGNVKSGTFKGLTYSVGVNFDHYANKLIKYGTEEKLVQNSISYIRREGEEWNAFYLLEVESIFQSEEEVANSPKQYGDNTLPGDLKWKDQNTVDTDGDGIPDAPDGVINDDDRIVFKGQHPLFQYSYNINAAWRGFDFYVLFNGVNGSKFYVADWGTVPFSQGAPPTTEWRNRWTEDNPSETMPRIYWGRPPTDRINRPSSFFLKDGTYLRMKNISIGYTVPAAITRKIGIDNLKFYFSGDNILTITKFPGLDPERIANNNRLVSYPQNKIFSFGINLTI